MSRLFILAGDTEAAERLAVSLAPYDFTCTVASDAAAVADQMDELRPEMLLVEVERDPSLRMLAQRLRRERKLPTIALARLETIGGLNGQLEIDDFVRSPADPQELAVRARRLLHKAPHQAAETIRQGDLVIDTARCEVTIAGRPVLLTFKEYELLKFLTSNPGRVFTRETLLDRVWGYDYFGGDRTVDVHVRRLRGKLDVAGHRFIETVRNVGYAFRHSVTD